MESVSKELGISNVPQLIHDEQKNDSYQLFHDCIKGVVSSFTAKSRSMDDNGNISLFILVQRILDDNSMLYAQPGLFRMIISVGETSWVHDVIVAHEVIKRIVGSVSPRLVPISFKNAENVRNHLLGYEGQGYYPVFSQHEISIFAPKRINMHWTFGRQPFPTEKSAMIHRVPHTLLEYGSPITWDNRFKISIQKITNDTHDNEMHSSVNGSPKPSNENVSLEKTESEKYQIIKPQDEITFIVRPFTADDARNLNKKSRRMENIFHVMKMIKRLPFVLRATIPCIAMCRGGKEVQVVSLPSYQVYIGNKVYFRDECDFLPEISHYMGSLSTN